MPENVDVSHWLWTVFVFGIALFAILAVKKLLWNKLQKWASSTEAHWDDLLLQRIQKPVTVLSYIAAFAIAFQTAPAEVRTHTAALLGIKIAVIAVSMWIFDRMVLVLVLGSAIMGQLSRSMQVLFLTILRVILFSLGILIILDTLGISITPLLASLGVGSVAVALALQDTLSNFFSGIYLLVDEPVRLGDFVRLDDGMDGNVERIGWRSTRIRTLGNNTVVVPNSKLASARITNFDSPDKEMGFGVDLGVSYDSDLEKVERIACEVARQIMQTVQGGVPTCEPALRYSKFGESSIDFSVGMRIQQYTDQYLVRHEFIKALHKRFQQEGISIPYPHRVVIKNT